MFFNKKLNEKVIVKMALDIINQPSDIKRSMIYFAKAENPNIYGLIAIHLCILKFLVFIYHGERTLTITNKGISDAIVKNKNAELIMEVIDKILAKGPDYLTWIIQGEWVKQNENPFVATMDFEINMFPIFDGYYSLRKTPLINLDTDELLITPIEAVNNIFDFRDIFLVRTRKTIEKIKSYQL